MVDLQLGELTIKDGGKFTMVGQTQQKHLVLPPGHHFGGSCGLTQFLWEYMESVRCWFCQQTTGKNIGR